MAYIQAEIEADEVIRSMNDDGQFAFELWSEIMRGLHLGLLLDNASDIAGGLNSEELQMWRNSARSLTDAFEYQLEQVWFFEQVEEAR